MNAHTQDTCVRACVWAFMRACTLCETCSSLTCSLARPALSNALQLETSKGDEAAAAAAAAAAL